MWNRIKNFLARGFVSQEQSRVPETNKESTQELVSQEQFNSTKKLTQEEIKLVAVGELHETIKDDTPKQIVEEINRPEKSSLPMIKQLKIKTPK